VSVCGLAYALGIEQSTHQLALLRDGQPLRTSRPAPAPARHPSANGEFYLKELLRPINGVYGPYAHGLFGHSTVLTSFDGGDGQIGLNGTSDTTSIGRSTSHGCIRLRNPDITYFAQLLPLGTPITTHT
jgi:lipoprotein-anchoring transpeptidase ErfK/SrfK